MNKMLGKEVIVTVESLLVGEVEYKGILRGRGATSKTVEIEMNGHPVMLSDVISVEEAEENEIKPRVRKYSILGLEAKPCQEAIKDQFGLWCIEIKSLDALEKLLLKYGEFTLTYYSGVIDGSEEMWLMLLLGEPIPESERGIPSIAEKKKFYVRNVQLSEKRKPCDGASKDARGWFLEIKSLRQLIRLAKRFEELSFKFDGEKHILLGC